MNSKVNTADFAAFNERYFTGKPARSGAAVKELSKSVFVEIEAIAVRGEQQ